VDGIANSKYGFGKLTVYKKIKDNERDLDIIIEPVGRGRKLILITKENAGLFYRIPEEGERKVEQPAKAGSYGVADNGDKKRRRPSPLADAMYAEIEKRGRMMTPKELARCPRIKRVSKSRTLANTVYTTADSNRDRFVREGAGYNIKPRK